MHGSPRERGRPLAERSVRARPDRIGVTGGELPAPAAGIGVSAGPVVAGNVGAADRYEYTVIGDPVNEAARLADLAKLRPERLLASEAIILRTPASEANQWELGEAVTLRGRPAPTRIAYPRAISSAFPG